MKQIFFIISAFLVMSSIAMADVTVSKTKPVNAKWQFVAVTLSADGDSCLDIVATPVLADVALQTYVDGQEDVYVLDVLKLMYPNARPEERTLESFEAWITAGNTNAAYCRGKNESTEQACTDAGGRWIAEEVIEKVPWVNSWSAIKVTAEKEMAENPLTSMTKSQLNTYIDNNWTNLTDSKATFKKLVELIYDMIRRNGWE